ncbi:type I pullulanase [Bacillus sp. HMF5848]|uniref:type I pullulanase n=1 Tax=Bacillus sp. HMF5848 TaxID=2495421 RepID=UPI000F772CEF|nr:type I pullulanase [Bacillus sp. HMF5848]
MAVQKQINYNISYGDGSVFSKSFDEKYTYNGDDLGVTYTKEDTTFRLWAPTAEEAYVNIYEKYDSENGQSHPLVKAENGTWSVTLTGDLAGKYYTYKVRIEEEWNEAVDPYARAVGVNGDKGAIIDLADTTPVGWPGTKPPLAAPTDAIIYELHVRDASMHPESGIQHKGKYLGLTELGTKGPGGIQTGLDHIKSLGVTHVQLLPVYDYSTDSVDETRLDEEQYNWGYDPKNYNAPEGSYATNPYDPASRIKELKQLIKTMHDNGLRVIMDVVYNHVFDAYRMSFTKLVPGYYFRYDVPGEKLADGSACGNDTASERTMVRKFIVDSVCYWAKEYGFDGFRFDLMGLHDVDTMNEIRARLDQIDPTIMTIGEGWVLNTPLSEEQKANQENASKMPRIAHFNDYLRDGLKGSVFYEDEAGFVNGKKNSELDMKKGIVGGIAYDKDIRTFADEPNQTVSYVEAHDNHTVWDKLELTNPSDSELDRKKMHRLATAIVLTSQGIAFLHAGQEFMRTKGGDENSYKSPTSVNWLDWQRCYEFGEDVDYVRSLISIRRKHPAFRMQTTEQIRKHLFFEKAPKNCVAYTLRNHANDDDCETIFVIHNANRKEVEVTLPSSVSKWDELLSNEAKVNKRTVLVPPLSTVILGSQTK